MKHSETFENRREALLEMMDLSSKSGMKTLIIKDYIQGLASFLDEENIKWDHLGEGVADWIKIYYKDDLDLFKLAFKFGRFYETTCLRV